MRPIVSLAIFLIANLGHAAGPESAAWLRYFRPEIVSPEFYLTPERTPAAEWDRAVRGFRARERITLGGEDRPLRCWFPARAALIERLTGETFPAEDCPDVDRWRKAFGQERLSVVFASYFANNPASLFGHTFLRFSPSRDEDRSDKLRTYSAGFLAATDPNDGRGAQIYKGLFGFYDGFFNVKPHYMNAALYNNSESRDLWEYPLTLRPDEVRWASLLLWEMSHFGGMKYYFVDWNCSYRLLTFLETVRPELNLSARTGIFVLPLDTVRVLDGAGLIDRGGVAYEPSLRVRLNAKLDQMPAEARDEYLRARKDPAALAAVTDPRVLDALIDHWTHRTYESETKLSPKEKELAEATYAHRARMNVVSRDVAVERPAVDPDQGHRTSWAEAQAGRDVARLSLRAGAHDLRAPAAGYDDSSVIEYFGLDATRDVRDSYWRSAEFLIADAESLNPIRRDDIQMSWRVRAGVRSDQASADADPHAWADAAAGLGMSVFADPGRRALLFALAEATPHGLGVFAGLRWQNAKGGLLLTAHVTDDRPVRNEELRARASWWWTANRDLFIEAQRERWSWAPAARDGAAAGVRVYF